MEEERCQDVCGYIRSLIARGELHLGDRLPTERALSQALGVAARCATACACWKAWAYWRATRALATIYPIIWAIT